MDEEDPCNTAATAWKNRPCLKANNKAEIHAIRERIKRGSASLEDKQRFLHLTGKTSLKDIKVESAQERTDRLERNRLHSKIRLRTASDSDKQRYLELTGKSELDVQLETPQQKAQRLAGFYRRLEKLKGKRRPKNSMATTGGTSPSSATTNKKFNKVDPPGHTLFQIQKEDLSHEESKCTAKAKSSSSRKRKALEIAPQQKQQLFQSENVQENSNQYPLSKNCQDDSDDSYSTTISETNTPTILSQKSCSINKRQYQYIHKEFTISRKRRGEVLANASKTNNYDDESNNAILKASTISEIITETCIELSTDACPSNKFNHDKSSRACIGQEKGGTVTDDASIATSTNCESSMDAVGNEQNTDPTTVAETSIVESSHLEQEENKQQHFMTSEARRKELNRLRTRIQRNSASRDEKQQFLKLTGKSTLDIKVETSAQRAHRLQTKRYYRQKIQADPVLREKERLYKHNYWKHHKTTATQQQQREPSPMEDAEDIANNNPETPVVVETFNGTVRTNYSQRPTATRPTKKARLLRADPPTDSAPLLEIQHVSRYSTNDDVSEATGQMKNTATYMRGEMSDDRNGTRTSPTSIQSDKIHPHHENCNKNNWTGVRAPFNAENTTEEALLSMIHKDWEDDDKSLTSSSGSKSKDSNPHLTTKQKGSVDEQDLLAIIHNDWEDEDNAIPTDCVFGC